MLHSGLMRCLLSKIRLFSLLLPAILWLAQGNAMAAATGSLHVHVEQKVLYCASQITLADNTFQPVTSDGITMATQWHIKIGRVRHYWLNDTVADISVIHRVTPDLLTRSWLLTDASSGISRRVYRSEDAIHFLSSLDNFPLLDRSLLQSDTAYSISANVKIHSEGIDNTWWNKLWLPTAATMQQEFTLP